MGKTKNYLSISDIEVLVRGITNWEAVDKPNLGGKLGYRGSFIGAVVEAVHRRRAGISDAVLEVSVFSERSKKLLATYSKYKDFMVCGSDEERRLDKLYQQIEETYRTQEDVSWLRELIGSH